MTPFSAIVLAAGEGTRMKGEKAKVLHEILGRSLIEWSVRAVLESGAERVVVVVGHGRDGVESVLKSRFDGRVVTALQEHQRGTGDAVRCGLPGLATDAQTVLILYGDCPLVPAETLRDLVQHHEKSNMPLTMLTSRLEDPTGYGRILRDGNGRVVAVCEQRDCTEEGRAIHEINPGMYAAQAEFLRDAIATLESHNAQKELYLTDVVGKASAHGGVADVFAEMKDLVGINDRNELARAAATMRDRVNGAHAVNGVSIVDPATTWIDAQVVIEPEAVIEPHVTLRGTCVIAKQARIDVGCVLENVSVGEEALVRPYTVAKDSTIASAAKVGPFAHLREGTDVGPEARIGNFVETKNTRLGKGSKANHLSYLGDGEIGDNVNVGAGTIFCNYDGFQKHTTVLEDGVFIGSDSQLIAPVRIGKNAYVATGSTINRDVPPEALAVARSRQDNKEGYAPRLRARLKKK